VKRSTKHPRAVVTITREEVTARGMRTHRSAWRFEYHVGSLLPAFSKLSLARLYVRERHPGCKIVYAWRAART